MTWKLPRVDAENEQEEGIRPTLVVKLSLAGEHDAVSPTLGDTEVVRTTCPVNPAIGRLATVTVVPPIEPRFMVTEVGVAESP